MKQIIVSKLFRKFLILSFLIFGLVFFVSGSNLAESCTAAPCCEECDAQLNQCTSECAQGDFQCLSECFEINNDCSSHCVMCGGGGGGGGSCQVASDCPPRPENPFPQCVGWNCVY